MQFCFTLTRKKVLTVLSSKVAFLIHTHVLTADKFNRIFGFYRILDRHFVHQRDARIGFTAQRQAAISTHQFIETSKVETTSTIKQFSWRYCHKRLFRTNICDD